MFVWTVLLIHSNFHSCTVYLDVIKVFYFPVNKDFDNIKLRGTTVRIIDAQQAKLCTSCKNAKLKLLKTNTAIRFNKMGRVKHLKPNYIDIKINEND